MLVGLLFDLHGGIVVLGFFVCPSILYPLRFQDVDVAFMERHFSS